MRGGSGPEVIDVTFDAKVEGNSNWVPMGMGTRIPGGWQLARTTWSGSGVVRARGRAGGSLFETVSILPGAIEAWRRQYFATYDNKGDAADDADPDHDGLTNFAEFAFGLSPVDRQSNTLPEFTSNGDSFTASFSTPAGRQGVLYSAESSPTMLPGTWSAIVDTGTGDRHIFHVPAAGPRTFIRFVVRVR